LSVKDYRWATRQIVRAAAEIGTCRGRLVSVLEGGYDIDRDTSGLAQAVQAHVRELMRSRYHGK
jgi:acetoin utilization deacetylase AcuC-like enzyme